ncbi:DTW domain-containing protein [Vibrio panuliri]|uniref:tRNA-uridine aminocarboxypropyltransferase n=1 Tax=Vibrio panuliri TaxID=1381081 RepID=A0A1Q9HF92_9VIBR|nr:tRNA-uridine aminocarboxypropyltransferase [Vibrio panuliri]OLQ88371.1 DTW domain-containing protein [Vibrio panuliri]
MRIHAFHHLYQQRLALSTKAFNARGSKVERCQYCQVAANNCICDYQPQIESDVAVMLIVSENEVFKPSNTGRLILDTIQEGYAFQWNRTDPDPKMLALLQDPSYQPLLVFPADYVENKQRVVHQPLNQFCDNKKPLIILLDGSWREARRMFRKSPYLDNLPVVSIHPQAISQYMMRKSDNEQHLATAEVAIMVLQQLEQNLAANTLDRWFRVFRESYLMSKTQFKSDENRPELKRLIEEMTS